MSVTVQQPADPWQRTTTEHGFAADEVISALKNTKIKGLRVQVRRDRGR